MILRTRANKIRRQERRRHRLRKRIIGTPERPRLSVARSTKHIYVQIVDDTAGKTLAFVGTAGKSVEGKTKTLRALWAGKKIAELAKEKGITQVVFDRGGRQYHGRVKAVADGAREAGLSF